MPQDISKGAAQCRLHPQAAACLCGQGEGIPLQRLRLVQIPALQQRAMDGICCARRAGGLLGGQEGAQAQWTARTAARVDTQNMPGLKIRISYQPSFAQR